jgi:hypothetical protein
MLESFGVYEACLLEAHPLAGNKGGDAGVDRHSDAQMRPAEVSLVFPFIFLVNQP